MEQARDSGAVRAHHDCLGPDDGSSQQQSGLAEADGSWRVRSLRRGCGDRNSARPCHLHSILRHVSARGAEFDAERRRRGESSRTGGHRRADPAPRTGARTRCAGHTGTRRDDSRKIHGRESRLKDAFLKSEELTQRGGAATKRRCDSTAGITSEVNKFARRATNSRISSTEDTKKHREPQRNQPAAFSRLYLFFSCKPSVLSVAFLRALCVEFLGFAGSNACYHFAV